MIRTNGRLVLFAASLVAGGLPASALAQAPTHDPAPAAGAADRAATPPPASQPAALPPSIPTTGPAAEAAAAGQPGALPAHSPFDAYDPEVRAVQKLDWRRANFNALDEKQKAAALVALNQMLDVAGAKADARADLLVTYLDKGNLGTQFRAEEASAPQPAQLTFEDAKKIAAAFIESPAGRNQFAGEFANTPPNMQAEYLQLYEKTCRRKFDDVAEARGQVRAMAKFLEKSGKLNDFLAWSVGESERRQKEHEAELARNAQENARQQQERREAALASARQERENQQELALRRLDYQYQLARAAQEEQATANPSAATNASNAYNDDAYNWGWGYGWGPTYYYSVPGYQAQARQRIGQAYHRWNNQRRVPGVWSGQHGEPAAGHTPSVNPIPPGTGTSAPPVPAANPAPARPATPAPAGRR